MTDRPLIARARRHHAGRLRQAREARRMRAALARFSAALVVQVGGGEANWIASARYSALLRVGAESSGVAARCHPEALPLDTGSADLVLLIHVFETAADPLAAIREAARVLRGEGRLVVVARHLPASPLGWPAAFAGRKRLASCGRLRRAMENAGLEWRGGADFVMRSGRRKQNAACLGLGYASYAAMGVKRQAGMRVIRPAWKDRVRGRSGVLTEHGQTG